MSALIKSLLYAWNPLVTTAYTAGIWGLEFLG